MNGCRTMGVKVAPQSAEAPQEGIKLPPSLLDEDGRPVRPDLIQWLDEYVESVAYEDSDFYREWRQLKGALDATPAMAKPESAAMEARMAEPARVLPRLKSLFDGMEGGAENPHYKAELADLEEQVAVLKKMEAQTALLDTLAGALEVALNSDMAQREEDEGNVSETLNQMRAALSRFKAYKEGTNV